MKLYRLPLLALLAAPASAAAGDVLYVDGHGNLGAYATVQEAVDAAQAGDVVFVAPGTYSGGLLTTKGVAVVAEGPCVLQGHVEAMNVAAGETFAMSGFDFDGPVEMEFFEGSARIQRCTSTGQIFVRKCPDAAVTQCMVQRDACIGVGLQLWSSQTATFETEAFGYGPCCIQGSIGHGIAVVTESALPGYLYASGCLLVGGGGDTHCGCQCGATNGSGLALGFFQSADVVSSTLVGSDGVALGNQDIQFVCDCCDPCNGQPGAPVNNYGSGTLNQPATPHRRFISDPYVLSGQPVLVRFVGEPGDVVELLVSDQPDFVPGTPLQGPLLVGAPFQTISFGTIPAGGEITTTWTAPTLAQGEGARTLFLQSSFTAGADVFLRTTTTLAVLDDDPCRPYNAAHAAPYCTPTANSSGEAARMTVAGSASVSANDLQLLASPLPANHSALFIYGPDQASDALGNGTLCIGSQTLGFVLRLPPTASDANGLVSHALDNTAPPAPEGQILPGETWYFSCWFRDIPAGGFHFNFADGIGVTFCP